MDLLASGPLVSVDHGSLNRVLEHILSKLKDNTAAIAALADTVAASEQRVHAVAEDLKSQLDTVKGMVESRDSQIESLAKTQTKHEIQIKNIATSLEKVKDRSNEAHTRIDGLLAERAEQKQQPQSTIDDVEVLKIKARVKDLESRDVSRKVEELQAQTGALAEQLSGLDQRVGSLESSHKDMSTEVSRHTEGIKRTAADLEALVRRVSAAELALQRKAEDAQVERNTRDIADLKARPSNDDQVKELKAKQELVWQALQQLQAGLRDANSDITTNRQRLAELGKALSDLDSFASKSYCEENFKDLADRIDKLADGFKAKLQAELKVFEADLMEYLEDHVQRDPLSIGGDVSKTAVGRTHYRCITCDTVVHKVTGPETPGHALATIPPPFPPPYQTVKVGNFLIEGGEEVPLITEEGRIYKGRTPTRAIRHTNRRGDMYIEDHHVTPRRRVASIRTEGYLEPNLPGSMTARTHAEKGSPRNLAPSRPRTANPKARGRVKTARGAPSSSQTRPTSALTSRT